mmetsp:Transcript_10642/g.65617  ORF Transcript_10642/g.65617 Transcript_10642/m.65617 type:complete len:81 (+) Transcript_10642:3028-3270(+)
MILMPEMRTLQKRNVVIPPITHSGMEEIIAAMYPKIPIINSQHPHAIPAYMLAHLVSEMTPLFWLNVVFGMLIARHEILL